VITILLRIAVVVLALGMLLPGFVGVFRPERLAEALALEPQGAVGWVAIRVLVGAPYIAMGLVALYAAARRHWALLAPVAAIEGVMALVRIGSGLTEGFEAASVGTIIVELVACLVLSLAAILPARSGR
jgi:hypothetical protein